MTRISFGHFAGHVIIPLHEATTFNGQAICRGRREPFKASDNSHIKTLETSLHWNRKTALCPNLDPKHSSNTPSKHSFRVAQTSLSCATRAMLFPQPTTYKR